MHLQSPKSKHLAMLQGTVAVFTNLFEVVCKTLFPLPNSYRSALVQHEVEKRWRKLSTPRNVS